MSSSQRPSQHGHSSQRPKHDVLYFGCWSPTNLGHFLYNADGYTVKRTSEWLGDLDGEFCPRDSRTQGRGALHHAKDGDGVEWTLIAFHDYTGDSRPGSNSVILVKGTKTHDEACSLFKVEFPEQWERWGEVMEVPYVSEDS